MEFTIIKNTGGHKEIDFGNGRSTQGFYQLAQKLESILSITYHKKNDNFNTLTWNYSYHGVPFILHHHWDSGTTIQLQSKSPTEQEELILDDIAHALLEFK
ncbi:MAG: hypothetical protein H7Y00_15655 [Fimbriimonadaceae bacterium]|nr:hypothetical protein [Chitinophagales bacterium]